MNALKLFHRFRFSSRLTTKIGDPWKALELYLILDSKQPNGSRPTAMDCFPNSIFTKINYLISQPLNLITDTSTVTNFSSTLFECKNSADLQKLHTINFKEARAAAFGEGSASIATASETTNDFFVAMNENWSFDAVRKLPWKFHNQGINPIFMDVNKNLNWQHDKSACGKLYAHGVTMPIDLMAVARWRRNQSNWLQMSFGEGRANSLEQLSAVYLMELQVASPYYIYESDIDQWKQWLADGSVKLQS